MSDARCQHTLQDVDAVLQCFLPSGGHDEHEASASSGYICRWRDTPERPKGVWVVWDYGDGSPVIRMAFAEEIEALRAANARRMMEKVDFLPYGEEFVPK